MRLDQYSNPIYQDADLKDLIYKGHISSLEHVVVDPSNDIEKFNQYSELKLTTFQNHNYPISEFDQVCQNDWFMPDTYKNLDIEAWLFEQCPPWDPENARVSEELAAFKDRNMLDLLRWMKYFVDTCRSNRVVWGVGRGSSVASYVLYLIGVHRIDSLKYNLDWREFLR